LGMKQSLATLVGNHPGHFPHVYTTLLKPTGSLDLCGVPIKNVFQTEPSSRGENVKAKAKLLNTNSAPAIHGNVLVTDIQMGTIQGFSLAFVHVPDHQAYYVVKHDLTSPSHFYPVCASCNDPKKYKTVGQPVLKCYTGDTQLYNDFKEHIDRVHDAFKNMYNIEKGNLWTKVNSPHMFARLLPIVLMGVIGMSVLNPKVIPCFNIPEIKNLSGFRNMGFLFFKDLMIQVPHDLKMSGLTYGAFGYLVAEAFNGYFEIFDARVFCILQTKTFGLYVFFGMALFYGFYASRVTSAHTHYGMNANHLTTEFLALAILTVVANIIFSHEVAALALDVFYPTLVCLQLVAFI